MNLVDDVDLEARLRRGELHRLAQTADVIHAVVRGTVDLDHVEGVAAHDLEAEVARVARLRRRPLLAVERLGEEPREGGLADAARSYKEIGMRHAVALDRVRQGAGDVFLPDDVGKLPGTPLAC